MISIDYMRTMAAYNGEMNRRLYAAAADLSDEARRQDRGAFWSSIHGTLCHLLWADLQWMSRFAAWPKPPVPLAQSSTLIADFAELRDAREAADTALVAWVDTLTDADLGGDLVWFSGAAQKEMRMDRALLLAHLFNHQTHHRGQIHAMLTAAGQVTGDTDLFLVVAAKAGL